MLRKPIKVYICKLKLEMDVVGLDWDHTDIYIKPICCQISELIFGATGATGGRVKFLSAV